MPDICIMVTSLELQGGNVYVQGTSAIDGQETQVGWDATFSWNAIPAVANSAIVDAAIAEIENALSIQVGIEDNKTLLGGAVGLV